MHSFGSVGKYSILFQIFPEQVFKISFRKMGLIRYINLFLSSRNYFIEILNNGLKTLYKRLSLLKNLTALLSDRLIINLQRLSIKGSVFCKELQQGIPLLNSFLVLYQVKEVLRIGLRNHRIEELPPTLPRV